MVYHSYLSQTPFLNVLKTNCHLGLMSSSLKRLVRSSNGRYVKARQDQASVSNDVLESFCTNAAWVLAMQQPSDVMQCWYSSGTEKDKHFPAAKHRLYRRHIGKLLYLAFCTSPEKAFFVCTLARSLQVPQKPPSGDDSTNNSLSVSYSNTATAMIKRWTKLVYSCLFRLSLGWFQTTRHAKNGYVITTDSPQINCKNCSVDHRAVICWWRIYCFINNRDRVDLYSLYFWKTKFHQ